MADADQKMTVSDFLLAAQRGDLAAVERALDQGLAADDADGYGNRALMYAAAAGQTRTCKFLIERGASPEAKNKWGLSAQDWCKWPSNADDVRQVVF